jgi:hypothetical protein
MRHFFSALMIFIVLILFFAISHENVTATVSLPSKSFGGRVLLAPIPGVTCLGIGKLMILSSNVGALVGAVASATNKDSNTTGKIISTAMNLYGLIPTYATNPLESPKISGQILGTEKWIPSFTTCYIGTFPIPVLKTTSNYGVSK